MNLNKKDIAVGLLVLVILAGVVYLITRSNNNKTPEMALPTPSASQKIEDTFNIDLPENAERADLNDVSGGDGYGVATRDGQVVTVLADLPGPENGQFYQVWMSSGEGAVSLGKMRVAKGGYLVETTVTKEVSEYGEVFITLEKVFDSTPETHILEGSF